MFQCMVFNVISFFLYSYKGCLIMKHDLADLGRNGGTIEDFSGVVHCCTLSLCHLGSEIDDHHRHPNINTEII